MLGLGLGISKSGIIIRDSFSAQYQAILTEATAQGYTLPSAGQQAKQNTLMAALVSSGVFAKVDVLFVFANDGSKEFACINWKNPTGNKATLIASPTFTSNQGFTGNGSSSYINTNYNPNGTLNYKLNDASRYVYLRTPAVNKIIDGIESSVTANAFSTFISAVQRINQGGTLTTGLIDYSGVGMMSIHRTSSTSIIGINNTTQTSAASTSSSLVGANQVLFRAGTNYTAHQASFYAMGASLVSENNALVSAFSTYLESILNLSPEALAWRNNIVNNGGTITDAQLAFMDTWFFKPAKTAGNILTELDRLNIYCNLVGSEIAARTNMIKSAHFVTPVNSPTFDNNGYKSVGTGYLNLNYNPKTQGVKLTLNSATIFAVVKNPPFTTTRRVMGAFNSGSFDKQLVITRNLNNLQVAVNTLGSVFNTNIATGNVFIGGRRQNALNQDTIINASIVNAAQPSTDIPDFNQFELVASFNGSPLAPFDNISHLCSGHGSGNLNISGLQTILNNLFTAAGI